MRRVALGVVVIVAVVIAAVALASAARTRHGSSGPPDGAASVVRVVDGDTIVADIGGREETVRLIGIDTPETKKPGTPVECFGPEASARMRQLLPTGTAIRLERDKEARDRYGRLLAYVYRQSDALFVELTMLQEGYAGPLAIAPNTAHRAQLDAAAAEARAAARGLWGACGGFHVQRGG